MVDKASIGRLGEEAAAGWLERAGFEILERNWRSGRYEVDIIAQADGDLHIVEVKCRARGGLTQPQDAYTPAKLQALYKAAGDYIEEKDIDADTHFDLIAVVHSGKGIEVEYYPDAIPPTW